MTKRADYTPPSCAFHDALEAHAVRRQVVRIAFESPEGAEQQVVGTIADIWAEAGAEYLRTDQGTIIRLDRLQGVHPQG